MTDIERAREVAAFAARLHGREYRDEMTGTDQAEAKIMGLLVVFGASDDLLEFRGVLNDEIGAWEGCTVALSRDMQIIEGPECADDLKAAGWTPPAPLLTVTAEWCPAGFDGSWRITSDAPFEPFDIMEDGELYCRGCVIDARRLVAAELEKERADEQ